MSPSVGSNGRMANHGLDSDAGEAGARQAGRQASRTPPRPATVRYFPPQTARSRLRLEER